MIKQIRGSKQSALFWSTLAFFAGFAAVSAYGPVVALLKKSMSLTPVQVGLLAAIPALTGSLLRIPFGAMVDRTGGKRPLIFLLLASALGIGSMALAFYFFPSPGSTQYPLFIGLGLLAGCGVAIFSVGIPAVSYWFKQKEQGTALAVFGGIGNLAPGLFAVILPALVVSVGLSAAYLIWLGLLLVVVLLLALFQHDAPSFQLKTVDRQHLLRFGQELIPTGQAVESLKTAASNHKTWILTAVYFVTFGGFIALTSWLPAFWSQFFSLNLVIAGSLTAVFSVSASLFRVAGGPLSDRYGGERVMFGSLLIILFGSLVVCFVDPARLIQAVAGILLIALGMGFGNASVFKLVPKFSPKTVGGSSGLVGGLGAFGGFIFPPAFGLVISQSANGLGYANAFWIFVVLSAVSSLPLFALNQRTGSNDNSP